MFYKLSHGRDICTNTPGVESFVSVNIMYWNTTGFTLLYNINNNINTLSQFGFAVARRYV